MSETAPPGVVSIDIAPDFRPTPDAIAPQPRDRARAVPPPMEFELPQGSGDVADVHQLYCLIEELQARVRALEAGRRHAESSWGQRVFLAQPDGGGTLLVESTASYSGANPTTAAMPDPCRSFLKTNLITPPAGAVGIMEFDFGTARAYAKLPGGVDLLQAGTNVISATPFINLPTNRGTANVFEFVTATISGTPGANLQFKAGTADNVGVYWHASSGTWVIGYAQFHA